MLYSNVGENRSSAVCVNSGIKNVAVVSAIVNGNWRLVWNCIDLGWWLLGNLNQKWLPLSILWVVGSKNGRAVFPSSMSYMAILSVLLSYSLIGPVFMYWRFSVLCVLSFGLSD